MFDADMNSSIYRLKTCYMLLFSKNVKATIAWIAVVLSTIKYLTRKFTSKFNVL